MKLDATETWVAGHLALTLLAVDPDGLRGAHLRARASPVRDAFLAARPDALGTVCRIPPHVDDATLFGGLDLSATLSAGQIVQHEGLIFRDGLHVLPMAESCRPGLSARLAQAMDAGRLSPLLLIDEGTEDESAPPRLSDRLAFHIDLDGLRAVSLGQLAAESADIREARAGLTGVAVPDDALGALCGAAVSLGIASLRAPLLALRCARAYAALLQRKSVTGEDLEIASQLVYAHRATLLPDPPEAEPDTAPEDAAPRDEQGESETIPDELLIDAVRAVLPDGALGALERNGNASARAGAGAGSPRRSFARGRPLPSRPGRPGGAARLDLIATLRAAAPWQTLRRAALPDRTGLILDRSDFRIRQNEERSERLVIFLVDASGSAAMTRLAEAKGAVERLLADSYAKRDHVAVISFRGDGAQTILPPTRSLVQAKRRLAALPGGGGTPLAAGLKAAMLLAQRESARGKSPALALLTDGRANVPLDPTMARSAAQSDASQMAGLWAQLSFPCLVMDTGARPSSTLAELARLMRADYLPLPRASGERIRSAVAESLER